MGFFYVAQIFFIQYAILFVLIFSFSGCDAIYRMLDKEGAEEKELVGDIVPFEQNPTIQEVQSLLKVYGYNVGSVDGILGLYTRNAIEKFQKDNGLNPSRFVDKETWKRLKIPVAKGFIVDGEVDPRFLQERLKNAGYDPGVIDGKIGAKTTAAVKAFQKAQDLKVDGNVGFQTLYALSTYADLEISR